MVNVDASRPRRTRTEKRATLSRLKPTMRAQRPTETSAQVPPIIEVSELDGMFNVYADFQMVPDGDNVTVEFAQQGMVISGGTVQRYIPIPTDGVVEMARVDIADSVARIAIPTAGLGHRWRAIVMW